MGKPIRLAVFDMDGTLTQERNSWDTFFDHYDHDASEYYDLFFTGHLGEKEWAEINLNEIIKERSFLNEAEVEKVLVEGSHLRTGLRECVADLRSLGIDCMIISCGLDPLARWIGKEMGFRDWKANWYETDSNGNLLPRYIGKVFFDDKAAWLRYWMNEYHVGPERTVAIGDGSNDIGLFQLAGHSIAFNPSTEKVAESGDEVVVGDDLRECSKLIRRWCDG